MKTGRYYIFIILVFSILIAKIAGVSGLLVATGSMEPAISTGDFVIAVPVRKIAKGDIISYKYEGKVITHRITDLVEINRTVLIKTKGDNNVNADTYFLSEKDVIGKVVFIVPSRCFISKKTIPLAYWLLGYILGLLLEKCVVPKTARV